MRVFLAEEPIARAMAMAHGATLRDGVHIGPHMAIAALPLATFATPEAYDGAWSLDTLPILPDPWQWSSVDGRLEAVAGCEEVTLVGDLDLAIVSLRALGPVTVYQEHTAIPDAVVEAAWLAAEWRWLVAINGTRSALATLRRTADGGRPHPVGDLTTPLLGWMARHGGRASMQTLQVVLEEAGAHEPLDDLMIAMERHVIREGSSLVLTEDARRLLAALEGVPHLSMEDVSATRARFREVARGEAKAADVRALCRAQLTEMVAAMTQMPWDEPAPTAATSAQHAFGVDAVDRVFCLRTERPGEPLVIGGIDGTPTWARGCLSFRRSQDTDGRFTRVDHPTTEVTLDQVPEALRPQLLRLRADLDLSGCVELLVDTELSAPSRLLCRRLDAAAVTRHAWMWLFPDDLVEETADARWSFSELYPDHEDLVGAFLAAMERGWADTPPAARNFLAMVADEDLLVDAFWDHRAGLDALCREGLAFAEQHPPLARVRALLERNALA